MAENKNSTVHYQSYLQLEKILDAQTLMSEKIGGRKAHDEMLFIIIHQAYELWFKQILHEMGSVVHLFKNDKVDESNIAVAVSRLTRVVEIEKLLIDQIRILETMTPLDFLEFRNYLFPASGFQSFQFRLVETMMGLPDNSRISYGNYSYKAPFSLDQQNQLAEASNFNLFSIIESWLERTPFLQWGDFKFLKHYEKAVDNMFETELESIDSSIMISDAEKIKRKETLNATRLYYDSIFIESLHEKLIESGEMRLSYKATVACLLINLYRDEPLLHHPFRLITTLVDIDELFTTWRYRHSQMVLRMLGKKMGTGGSSGHDYLHQTAVKHNVFTDFHNISTLLIPRNQLPSLPMDIKKQLSFYFTSKK